MDVRNILAEEQRKILAGCRIVFSRVFPVGEANPHHHPLWQTAEQFGAVCLKQIDDQVTHVVANSLGTDKVLLVLHLSFLIIAANVLGVFTFCIVYISKCLGLGRSKILCSNILYLIK